MPIDWGAVSKKSASSSSYSGRGIDWSKVETPTVSYDSQPTIPTVTQPQLFNANPKHKGITGFLSNVGAKIGNLIAPTKPMEVMTGAVQDVHDRFKAIPLAKTPLEKTGAVSSAAMGIVNLMFSPVSGALSGAEQVPGLKLVAKPVNWTFKEAADLAAKYMDQVKKLTPDSPEKKAVWKALGPVSKEIAGLAAQIAIGKIGADVVGGAKGMVKETNTAVDTLNRIKTTSAIAEIPPENLAIKRVVPSDGVTPPADFLIERTTGKPLTVITSEAQKQDFLQNGYTPPKPVEAPTESPFLTEARKYKSAEDMFHGTSKQAEQSIRNTGFATRDGRVFLSTEKGVADKLYSQGVDSGWSPGKGQDVGGLITLHQSDFNLLDATSAEARILRKQVGLSPDIPEASSEKFRALLQQNGYDGIKYPTGGKNFDVEIHNLEKLNSIIKSQSSTTPGVFYHVTDKAKVPSILEKNLLPSDGAYGRGIYLTKTEARAFEFGKNLLGKPETSVLKTLSDAKLKEIPIDTNNYGNWLSWVKEYLNSKGVGDVPIQEMYPTLQREIMKEGYDGIYLPKSDYALVYDPKKVSQLTDIWNQAQETKPVEAITTVNGQTPSKIATSIEAKAIEAKLTKKFEQVAGYEKINVADQAKQALDLVNTDLVTARKMIRGEEPLPGNLRGTSLITAMEEVIKKNKDAELAYELANSPLITETSVAAQELRLAAERTPDSATSKIIEIKKAREAKIKDLPKDRTATKKALAEEMKKNNLPKEELSFNKFLENITC